MPEVCHFAHGLGYDDAEMRRTPSRLGALPTTAPLPLDAAARAAGGLRSHPRQGSRSAARWVALGCALLLIAGAIGGPRGTSRSAQMRSTLARRSSDCECVIAGARALCETTLAAAPASRRIDASDPPERSSPVLGTHAPALVPFAHPLLRIAAGDTPPPGAQLPSAPGARAPPTRPV